MKYIIFILPIAFLISCNIQQNKDLPKDFGFCIETETNKVNMFDSTLIRRYMIGDTAIRIVFSKTDLAFIYNEFLNYNLDNLPDFYNPKGNIMEQPAFIDTFSIRFNNKTKKIVWIQSLNCSSLKDKYYHIKQEQFFKVVFSIVLDNKDYLSIEKSNIIFK